MRLHLSNTGGWHLYPHLPPTDTYPNAHVEPGPGALTFNGIDGICFIVLNGSPRTRYAIKVEIERSGPLTWDDVADFVGSELRRLTS